MPDEYRFRAIEDKLSSHEHTLRALGAAVGQVAGLAADMDSAQEDIRELRGLLRDAELSVAAQIRAVESQVRSGPVETLKLMGVVVGVFAALSGALIAVAKFALGVG